MRYKEFNKSKVLEDCISLFWKNGFGSCSINDIVKSTKVNRFSLYNEFDNKNGILLEALELYYARYSSQRIVILNKNKGLREVLKEFFESYLDVKNSRPPGCFTIHIATELADIEEEIKMVLARYLNEIQKAFIELLIKHEETKDNCQFISKHLIGLFCNAMCFCVIQTSEEQHIYIDNGLELLLTKNIKYDTHA